LHPEELTVVTVEMRNEYLIAERPTGQRHHRALLAEVYEVLNSSFVLKQVEGHQHNVYEETSCGNAHRYAMGSDCRDRGLDSADYGTSRYFLSLGGGCARQYHPLGQQILVHDTLNSIAQQDRCPL